MVNARELLERLLDGEDLSEGGAAELLAVLTSENLAPASAGALLAALRAKGVTAPELRGLSSAMLERARSPALAAGIDAIDIVGTGGDGSGSFNLSTAAALLAAACGVPVVKHGNRSVSSRCGSADLIEALGFKLPLDERGAAACFAQTGFTFLFAPYFHPAMKALAPVRAALGIRTVFNLLGPLTNPAAPRYRLIGACDIDTAKLLAATLAGMDVERAYVITGAGGWDEATPIGPFVAFEVSSHTVERHEIDPLALGIARCEARDLAGGDAACNLAALLALFGRRDAGAHLAAVVLQAGLALHIAGRAASLAEGMSVARSNIDTGHAAAWLARLREFAAREAAG